MPTSDTLTMHPQVIGRGHRMLLLERFIQHALARGGGRFARLADVAAELAANTTDRRGAWRATS